MIDSDVTYEEEVVELVGCKDDFDKAYEIDRIAIHRTEQADVSELESTFYEHQYSRLEDMSDDEIKDIAKNMDED